MKKIVSILLLLTLMVGAGAQKRNVGAEGSTAFSNTFLSGGVGLGLYNNYNAGKVNMGFAGGISFGKWIGRPLALRFSFDMASAGRSTVRPNGTIATHSSIFFLGTAEALWDIRSTISRISGSKFQLYPIFGLGLIFGDAISADHLGNNRVFDLTAMIGLQANYLFAPYWSAFVEGKLYVMPQGFDRNIGNNFLGMATVGIARNFFSTPFHRSTEFESRSKGFDWFFGIGLGPNFTSFEFEHLSPADGMYGTTIDLTIGRNFSEFWTIRMQLGGIRGHERFNEVTDSAGRAFTYGNLHADLMINLTHALRFSRGIKLNILPYLGSGLVWRFDDPLFDLGLHGGLMFRYYIGYHSDLYADLRYTMVHPRVGGSTGPSGSSYGVGIPSITIGYIYNFGNNSNRYRLPATWSAH